MLVNLLVQKTVKSVKKQNVFQSQKHPSLQIKPLLRLQFTQPTQLYETTGLLTSSQAGVCG